MDKKGIIFTVDVIIALAIFLISLTVFYSLFLELSAQEFTGTHIYSSANNILTTYDIGEYYSSAFNEYQEGNLTTAYMILELTLDNFVYPTNIKLYWYNNSVLSPVLVYGNESFSQSIVLRRYTIYTLTRDKVNNGTNVVSEVPSSLSNRTITGNVTVSNPTGSPIDVTLNLHIQNYTDHEVLWTVSPGTIVLTGIPAWSSETKTVEITIPKNTVVDTYYLHVTASGDLTEISVEPFSVFEFGMVEMEVSV